MQRVYQNISPDQFAKFQAQASAHGIDLAPINPDGSCSGQVNDAGCKIDYVYDGKSILTLTILSKPFLITADFIWSQLTPYLA